MHRAGEAFRRGGGRAPALAAGCGAESVMAFIAETERRVRAAMQRVPGTDAGGAGGAGGYKSRALAAHVAAAADRRAGARAAAQCRRMSLPQGTALAR